MYYEKTLKMVMSGVLALAVIGCIGFPASADAKGTLTMYHNIFGGPTKSTDTCTFARNTIDNTYYAQCIGLYNSKAVVSSPNTSLSRPVEFTEPDKIITFVATMFAPFITFDGHMFTIDVSNYSNASINLGY